jgi:cytochrome c oxidase subunit 2
VFIDCYSPIGELVVYFHDYLIEWMVMILVVRIGMFFFVMRRMYYDIEFVEHEMIEFVWTVVPMVVLVFIAGPSVFLLYLTEDVGSSGLIVKVIGHQWY